MVKKVINQLPVPHRILLSVAAASLTLASLLPAEKANASRQYEALELGKRYELKLDVAEQVLTQQGVELDDAAWQEFRVNKGDNLAKIFNRAGLSPQDTYRISQVKDAGKQLLKMMPGDKLALKIVEGQLQALSYSLNATEQLHIEQHPELGYQARYESKPVDTRLNYAQGEISSNFWNAGAEAGLTDNQIMRLADLFGWDIDFALEIRQGDHFNVIYEEKFIEGEFAGYGDIIAAEFVNQGDSYTAIKYQDGNFYSADGRSLRKSFLRAPVNFQYISSSFKKSRYHPVQKRWKAHRGVDYAANTGTPVVAAGDGKVIKAGYDKYNGHHVFIQHGEKYVTKYLHFSKRKVKRGQSVKQGQVIGLVGATGLASGPHLHYEFLVDGVHRNPRTVSLPKAKPIAKQELANFRQLADLRLEQLQTNKRIMLAMN